MVLFFTGLIVGAIASVVADRLWRKYEHCPKLDIYFGEFFDSKIGGFDEGYYFTITNKGNVEIPPYRICIYNPSRGSVYWFIRDRDSGTLPEQKLEHRCVIIRNKKLSPALPDFYSHNNALLDETQKNEFVFRLVLDNSEKIIYENKRMGNAFIRIFQNTRSSMNFKNNSYNDMIALRVKYEPICRKVFSYNWRII